MNKSCKKCLFGDICPRTRPCSDFAPLDESELAESQEEQNKKEYTQAWLAYVNEYE